MMLKKGDKVRMTLVNNDEMFKVGTQNAVHVFEVIRVNANTYTCDYIEGFLKGSGFKLRKNFPEDCFNSYGTHITYEVI